MTSKRGKPDIIFDILSAISESEGSIKPTRLLYKSNLSYARLKLYLESLIKQGLLAIKKEGDRKLISLTQKGYDYVVKYRQMKEFMESFGVTEI